MDNTLLATNYRLPKRVADDYTVKTVVSILRRARQIQIRSLFLSDNDKGFEHSTLLKSFKGRHLYEMRWAVTFETWGQINHCIGLTGLNPMFTKELMEEASRQTNTPGAGME